MQRFNKLTVICRVENKRNSVMWLCKCDCGGESIVSTNGLKSGNTKSCGCLQKKRASEANKRYNYYDLSGEFGIGYTRKGEEFYFDLEDYYKIKNYCWHIETGGRVVANKYMPNGKTKTPIKFHRLVMDCPDGLEVDHIFHNQYDNRKNFLRICKHSENMKNQKIPSNNTSGYKGVYFRKDTGKWTARIDVDNKAINLGCFLSYDEAKLARLAAEKKYYSEFRNANNYIKKI